MRRKGQGVPSGSCWPGPCGQALEPAPCHGPCARLGLILVQCRLPAPLTRQIDNSVPAPGCSGCSCGQLRGGVWEGGRDRARRSLAPGVCTCLLRQSLALLLPLPQTRV